VTSETGDYSVLFRANPLPTWVFDVDSLQFLDVNDAAVRHYGFTREQFLSMTLADIRPSEDVPALVDDVRRATNGPDVGVWRHRKADGQVIHVNVSAHSLTFAGRPARLVVANDITEHLHAMRRLESENALRRALDREEFRLHYQPIVALATGGTVATEAWSAGPIPSGACWDRLSSSPPPRKRV